MEQNKHDVADHLEDDFSDNESITSTSENNEESQTIYKESFWPAKPETPKGFTFNGKSKMMTYALNKIKSILKKGVEKEIDGIKFKILDVRTLGGATQITAEMTDSDGRGI